ncbi:MAG: substrate-binding domain-containing protein [Arenicellales bacterium]
MNKFLLSLVVCVLLPINMSSAKPHNILRLATTTSTENSGLLTYLLPEFEKQTGYQVRVISVGTGKALRMGRDGDADVLLVHAPSAEQDFMASGYGEQRVSVMHNDFVLVGMLDDAANVSNVSSLTQALHSIEAHNSLFISRGDDSGTHKKELDLWKAAGISPIAPWYREVGQGMGKVLQMAAEMQAYTLTDRGTWLAFQGKPSPVKEVLKIVYEKAQPLLNPYSMMTLSRQNHPDLNHEAANELIDWIVSKQAQNLIAEFKVQGQQLFVPDALR